MFEAAARRFPERTRAEMVMVGDQLGTDILGANRFGIDSVLVETGVDRWLEPGGVTPRPTCLLAGL